MTELNELAARVWKRVAAGEAYRVKPSHKATPAKQPVWSLLLLVIVIMYIGPAQGETGR